MDSFAHPSVPGQLERPAGLRASEQHDDRDRRLRQARRAARQGVRRHRAAGLDASHRVRRVRRRDDDSGGEGEPLHRHGAGVGEAGRRGDAGRVLPRRARNGVLPAERHDVPLLPCRSTSRDLDRWQSGMFYVDGTAEAEPRQRSRMATRDARGGVIAKCAGLALTPKAKVVVSEGRSRSTEGAVEGALTCDIDCTYRVRLERYPRGSTTLSTRGTALAGVRDDRQASRPPGRAPGAIGSPSRSRHR